MDYQEITREDCAEAMARILMVLSRIVLEPQGNSSDYEKAQIAFNAFAEGVDYSGAVFKEVVFDEEFEREFAKLFYGVGDTTIGLTHSFWSGGLIAVAGEKTREAFKTYRDSGLSNTSTLPEDHLAIELTFLSHLLVQNKVKEAQGFASEEVLQWWRTAQENINNKTPNGSIKNFFASVTSALEFVERM